MFAQESYLEQWRSSPLQLAACVNPSLGTSRWDRRGAARQSSVFVALRWRPGRGSGRPPRCSPHHPAPSAAPGDRRGAGAASPGSGGISRQRRTRPPWSGRRWDRSSSIRGTRCLSSRTVLPRVWRAPITRPGPRRPPCDGTRWGRPSCQWGDVGALLGDSAPKWQHRPGVLNSRGGVVLRYVHDSSVMVCWRGVAIGTHKLHGVLETRQQTFPRFGHTYRVWEVQWQLWYIVGAMF